MGGSLGDFMCLLKIQT